jgi:DNA-binding transcriptional MerR regulator
MKMRDLERRTGVNRETIRVYLRDGLLPAPLRPKSNVAEYDETHVQGILAIRELQRTRGLKLPQIRRALAGDVAALPTDPGAYPHLDALVATHLGVDGALVPIERLRERNPDALKDARALASVGAVRLQRRDGQVHLSPTDAQIVGLWGEMRAAGFTEELGFTPGITRFYVDAATRLAQEEVSRFLEILGDRLEPARTANLAKTAVELMLPFFGLLRVKAVLEAFAAHERSRPPD